MDTRDERIELIKKHFPEWTVSYWENYGKRRFYINPGHYDKKIVIDLDNGKAWANRPGAYTELHQLVEKTGWKLEVV